MLLRWRWVCGQLAVARWVWAVGCGHTGYEQAVPVLELHGSSTPLCGWCKVSMSIAGLAVVTCTQAMCACMYLYIPVCAKRVCRCLACPASATERSCVPGSSSSEPCIPVFLCFEPSQLPSLCGSVPAAGPNLHCARCRRAWQRGDAVRVPTAFAAAAAAAAAAE